MNLNNIGAYDRNIVLDTIWASLRDSLWSSITVPVFDSAWHPIRIYVGNNVHPFHTVDFSEYDDDEGDWL